MATYRIIVNGIERKGWHVEAESYADAIQAWLDMMGFDNIEHAAKECFCHPEDIHARRVATSQLQS